MILEDDLRSNTKSMYLISLEKRDLINDPLFKKMKIETSVTNGVFIIL